MLSAFVMHVLGFVFFFFTDGLKPDTKMLLTVASKKKSKAGKGDTAKEDESSKNDSAQPVTISLLFKRYVFDTQKKMIQSWESEKGLWSYLKDHTLKWIQVECVSCLNALELFFPHKQSLEAPADYVPPSKISAIWFCSVRICLLGHLCNVNLYWRMSPARWAHSGVHSNSNVFLENCFEVSLHLKVCHQY